MTENSHRYLKEIEMKEEAGTPAIVGAIRAGLVFQLKQVQDKINVIKTVSHFRVTIVRTCRYVM